MKCFKQLNFSIQDQERKNGPKLVILSLEIISQAFFYYEELEKIEMILRAEFCYARPIKKSMGQIFVFQSLEMILRAKFYYLEPRKKIKTQKLFSRALKLFCELNITIQNPDKNCRNKIWYPEPINYITS